MPCRVLPSIAILIALAPSAAADTEVLVVDPPAPQASVAAPSLTPSRTKDRLRFYAEMVLGYGRVHGEMVSPFTGYRGRTDSDVRGLRWAVGARLATTAMDVRLGAVLDVVSAGGEGAAIGLELQADWPLPAGWRAGGRVSISSGNGNGDPTTLDGVVGVAGLRLRKDVAIIGLDAVQVWHGDGSAIGGMLSVGMSGRPGKYLVGVSATAASILGVVAIVAMAGTTTH
jgi:hypothetical protein